MERKFLKEPPEISFERKPQGNTQSHETHRLLKGLYSRRNSRARVHRGPPHVEQDTNAGRQQRNRTLTESCPQSPVHFLVQRD